MLPRITPQPAIPTASGATGPETHPETLLSSPLTKCVTLWTHGLMMTVVSFTETTGHCGKRFRGWRVEGDEHVWSISRYCWCKKHCSVDRAFSYHGVYSSDIQWGKLRRPHGPPMFMSTITQPRFIMERYQGLRDAAFKAHQVHYRQRPIQDKPRWRRTARSTSR